MAEAFDDPITMRWQEEGLFARDMDGQLVREEKAQARDYYERVHLWIDDQCVVVAAAVPSTDSQGNILKDKDGKTIPRRTTIYDAAAQLFEKGVTDFFANPQAARQLETGESVEAPAGSGPAKNVSNPIPILCHQPHISPVGVCRVCSVEISAPNQRGSQVVPACHHPVRKFMVVKTKQRSERVRQFVSTLTELLVGDHQRGLKEPPGRDETRNLPREPNELETLATSLGIGESRFSMRSVDYQPDNSSPLISVNHNACILCERCVRGCSEIKGNFVIGRTGKGYAARIAFDLDAKMGRSSCVDCGECMISCPTDALTFRLPIESQWYQDAVAEEKRNDPHSQPKVTARELSTQELFKSVPQKFLQWNQASIVRRKLKPGQLLCRAGDYGATAFVLNHGQFGIWLPKQDAEEPKRRGFFGRLLPQPPADREPDLIRTAQDLILGEMSCLSDYPRTATVRALTDAEVFEIRRNVLYILQRQPVAREKLDRVYRERALSEHLRSVPLFTVLDEDSRRECVAYLRNRVELIRVDPGQVVFRQGERADDFYMIRLGYVKISRTFHGQERVLDYLGPNRYFGEIGIVSQMKLLGEEELPQGLADRRTATCSALDDVELVRVRGEDFRYLIEKHPILRDRMVQLARKHLNANLESRAATGPPLETFLEQGLFNAQKLLVLDLESCTRCDECVKACADTHGGVTRLVREGLRFDRFLVASACRSCTDPYCLVGCPVDAIHREGSDEVTEISIANHCIGCGQCAKNCPYGNINMHGEFDNNVPDYENLGRTQKAMVYKATTCDLCRSLPKVRNNPHAEVSCVYACPHQAAFRMTGTELLERLGGTPPASKMFQELE